MQTGSPSRRWGLTCPARDQLLQLSVGTDLRNTHMVLLVVLFGAAAVLDMDYVIGCQHTLYGTSGCNTAALTGDTEQRGRKVKCSCNLFMTQSTANTKPLMLHKAHLLLLLRQWRL